MGAGEANAEGDGSLQALAAKSARLTVPVALQAYMKRSLFIFSEGTHFHRYSRDDSRRHRSANKLKAATYCTGLYCTLSLRLLFA